MSHFLRLKAFLALMAASVILFGCSPDQRIDYEGHPELKTIQNAHPGQYNKIVATYSPKYKDDKEFNEIVVAQAHAIDRVFQLMSPEISFKFDQLTEDSGKDAFQIELARYQVIMDNNPELPLFDWVEVEQNMLVYLASRNEKVKILNQSLTAPDSTVTNINQPIDIE